MVHTPYRIAAPPPSPSEGFEAIDAYEAVLRARAGRARWATSLLSGVVVALWLGLASNSHRPAADLRGRDSVRALQRVDRARITIASTKAATRAEQDRFERDVLAAIDADLRPSAGDKPCTTSLPERVSALGARPHAFPLVIVERGDRNLPSPSLGPRLARIGRAEEQLDSARLAEGIASADALGSVRAPDYDVVLVASSLKHPARTTESTFAPGEIAGRAYLYDYARHRVTCAGDVHAASSPTIAYSFVPGVDAPAALDQGPSLAGSLERDLDGQVEHAIVSGLRAVD